MENPKTYQVTLKEEIQQIVDDLKDLENQGINRIELLEIAKLGALHELINRLYALDQTFIEISANIDNYVAERIESDKVVLSLLRDIQKQTSEPEVDQEPEEPDQQA
ncbi:MAG: hypothetical protein AMJ79_11825 [Phycisphaerae bacterium SM23_30]|nr:MAG: hypothetical protein AMJ79_11825 [Phycisphaerae bacterium SM23_30]